MTITFERAARAQDDLLDLIGEPDWLRAVSIQTGGDGAPYILVSVAHLGPEVTAAIPASIDGVAVDIEVASEIAPQ